MTTSADDTASLSKEPTWEECKQEMEQMEAMIKKDIEHLHDGVSILRVMLWEHRAAIYAKLAALARQQKDQTR